MAGSLDLDKAVEIYWCGHNFAIKIKKEMALTVTLNAKQLYRAQFPHN
jgi:hypothetical protein